MPIPTIELVDAQGRSSKEIVTKVDENTSQLDISKYVAGLYFLKIPTSTGHVVKQVVKN